MDGKNSPAKFGARMRGLPEPAPVAGLTRLSCYPWLVICVACLGAFAGQVDASIVQLGLPALEHAFDAPLSQVSWVAIAYSLSFAAVLPVYARLAEIAGRKFLYILGFALFGLFSALCGIAPSLPWLIAFRTLQGISGALLGANSVVVLVAAAGPARRARAMGIFAAAQAIGVSAGPALGGLLLDSLSWHWIFWVTVPFAALGAALGWLLVPISTPMSKDTGLDWRGALLLIPALTALMLALSKLNAWGALSPGVIGCLIASAMLLGGFVRHERRAASPLINPDLFGSRAFSGGTVAVLGAAPARHAGQAGGLLNLMRAFGTATGVASAAALLGWRLERVTGLHERTIGAAEDALLGAVADVMPLLAAYAVIAAIACSLRDRGTGRSQIPRTGPA